VKKCRNIAKEILMKESKTKWYLSKDGQIDQQKRIWVSLSISKKEKKKGGRRKGEEVGMG
jgi:hypothetical protein